MQCCPINCVVIPKLHCRTSHDELFWLWLQIQVETKHFFIFTSQQSISSSNFSKRKQWWYFYSWEFLFSFKDDIAKHEMTTTFQRIQSHKHLDFLVYFLFCLQFLCHNTFFGPVTFSHYSKAWRSNSIRKKHNETRKTHHFSLFPQAFIICEAKIKKGEPVPPCETTVSTDRQTDAQRSDGEPERFPMSIHITKPAKLK